MEMKKRSIAGCIILTFVTFGIYGIYWFVKLTNETNRLAPEEATMSGGLAFLVTLCALGIYGLYWGYKLWHLRPVLGIQAWQENGYHLRKRKQLRDHLPAAYPPWLRHYRRGACTERAERQDRETGERLRSCGMILNNTHKYIPRSAQRAGRGVSI